MPLFNGVENFSPALEGQRIAIGAGQGAGQSISRGMAIAQRGKEFAFQQEKYPQEFSLRSREQDLRERAFQFREEQINSIEDLDRMLQFLKTGMP